MSDLQPTLNYLNTAIAKLAFDGYSLVDQSTCRLKMMPDENPKTAIGFIGHHHSHTIALPESKIEEEQIVQLLGTSQMPVLFRYELVTADIDESETVHLFDTFYINFLFSVKGGIPSTDLCPDNNDKHVQKEKMMVFGERRAEQGKYNLTRYCCTTDLTTLP